MHVLGPHLVVAGTSRVSVSYPRARASKKCQTAKRHTEIPCRMEAGKSDSFRLLSECPLPTEVGDCMLRIYGDGTCTPWPVCVFGEVHGKSAVSVRLHDACMTSELFASVKCDCALQLRLAQSQLAASSGVLVCSRVHEAGLVCDSFGAHGCSPCCSLCVYFMHACDFTGAGVLSAGGQGYRAGRQGRSL